LKNGKRITNGKTGGDEEVATVAYFKAVWRNSPGEWGHHKSPSTLRDSEQAPPKRCSMFEVKETVVAGWNDNAADSNFNTNPQRETGYD
jgi:hypothetical protein